MRYLSAPLSSSESTNLSRSWLSLWCAKLAPVLEPLLVEHVLHFGRRRQFSSDERSECVELAACGSLGLNFSSFSSYSNRLDEPDESDSAYATGLKLSDESDNVLVSLTLLLNSLEREVVGDELNEPNESEDADENELLVWLEPPPLLLLLLLDDHSEYESEWRLATELSELERDNLSSATSAWLSLCTVLRLYAEKSLRSSVCLFEDWDTDAKLVQLYTQQRSSRGVSIGVLANWSMVCWSVWAVTNASSMLVMWEQGEAGAGRGLSRLGEFFTMVSAVSSLRVSESIFSLEPVSKSTSTLLSLGRAAAGFGGGEGRTVRSVPATWTQYFEAAVGIARVALEQQREQIETLADQVVQVVVHVGRAFVRKNVRVVAQDPTGQLHGASDHGLDEIVAGVFVGYEQ
ncbi:hypothetical protein BpHYR1_010789 [Brachionus plicatilis]|uniref:Uncharacterized protein n=1 Tax=Brachionus plicatilis TaxID=10195 RepID=A0A3M7QVH0_BRAPC|nr:hypothetical protein BpHYR1_010789 [Brachionus plicatilis]